MVNFLVPAAILAVFLLLHLYPFRKKKKKKVYMGNYPQHITCLLWQIANCNNQKDIDKCDEYLTHFKNRFAEYSKSQADYDFLLWQLKERNWKVEQYEDVDRLINHSLRS